MTDVETRIRSTLQGRAEQFAVTTSLKAICRDAAAPQPHRRHTRWGLEVAALVIAVMALGALLVVTTSRGPTAWAGWTPSAQPVGASDAASLEQACRASLTGPQLPNPGGMVAVDVRGSGGLAVFEAGSACAADRGEGSMFTVRSTSFGWSSTMLQWALRQLEATKSAVWVESGQSDDDPAMTYAWGVVSPDITSVTLETPRGTVAATVTGQTWLAWWPSAASFDLVLTGIDASGDTVVVGTAVELALADLLTPGERACVQQTADCPRMRKAELIAQIPTDDPAAAIVADGYVSDDEFARWVSNLQTCMSNKGFHITLTPREGMPTTYRNADQPGPVEPALGACQGPAAGLIELHSLQHAHPDQPPTTDG